jgi:hypothetical protein
MQMPDNYDLWVRHDAEQARWLEKRPVCCCCGEPIQEEKAFRYEGEWFCQEAECEKTLMEEVWEVIKGDYLVSVDD